MALHSLTVQLPCGCKLLGCLDPQGCAAISQLPCSRVPQRVVPTHHPQSQCAAARVCCLLPSHLTLAHLRRPRSRPNPSDGVHVPGVDRSSECRGYDIEGRLQAHKEASRRNRPTLITGPLIVLAVSRIQPWAWDRNSTSSAPLAKSSSGRNSSKKTSTRQPTTLVSCP